MSPVRTIIMGAAGRDFHNFNVFYRGNPDYKVEAFTATQIPNIDGRKYPAELAGELYPEGIPIYPESELVSLIKNVSEAVSELSARTATVIFCVTTPGANVTVPQLSTTSAWRAGCLNVAGTAT